MSEQSKIDNNTNKIPIFNNQQALLSYFNITNISTNGTLGKGILGKGTYGIVYPYGHYAFKTFRHRVHFMNEMLIYQYLSANSTDIIPKIYAFLISNDMNGILMERGLSVDWLYTHLSELEFIDVFINLAKQLINHLCNLDDLLICHRDLKPNNLILTFPELEWTHTELYRLYKENKVKDFLINNAKLKIIDWGTGIFRYNNLIKNLDTCTIWYCCPEFLVSSEYHAIELDVWSTGITMIDIWARFHGNCLFNAESHQYEIQLSDIVKMFGTFKDVPKYVNLDHTKITRIEYFKGLITRKYGQKAPIKFSKLNHMKHDKLNVLVNLLDQMLVLDFEKRIKPKDIKKHPFINVEITGNKNSVYKESTGNEDSVQKESTGNEDSVQKESTRNEDSVQKESTGNKDSVQKESTGNKDSVQKESTGNKDSVQKESTGNKDSMQKESTGNKDSVYEESTGNENSVYEEITGNENSVKRESTGNEDSVKRESTVNEDSVKRESTVNENSAHLYAHKESMICIENKESIIQETQIRISLRDELNIMDILARICLRYALYEDYVLHFTYLLLIRTHTCINTCNILLSELLTAISCLYIAHSVLNEEPANLYHYINACNSTLFGLMNECPIIKKYISENNDKSLFTYMDIVKSLTNIYTYIDKPILSLIHDDEFRILFVHGNSLKTQLLVFLEIYADINVISDSDKLENNITNVQLTSVINKYIDGMSVNNQTINNFLLNITTTRLAEQHKSIYNTSLYSRLSIK